MDSGVCWAAVHRVAESDTPARLSTCAQLRMGVGLAGAVGLMSSEQHGLMYRRVLENLAFQGGTE